jgi:hypothetical protein
MQATILLCSSFYFLMRRKTSRNSFRTPRKIVAPALTRFRPLSSKVGSLWYESVIGRWAFAAAFGMAALPYDYLFSLHAQLRKSHREPSFTNVAFQRPLLMVFSPLPAASVVIV